MGIIKMGFVLNSLSPNKMEFYDQAKKFGDKVVVEETKTGNHASELALMMALKGFTHIIAVGGDGTLHEVVNGVIQSGNKDVVVGLLPFGSANDFYKTLNGGSTVEQLINLATKKSYQEVDVGCISYNDLSGKKYFLNIADLGIGAEVVLRTKQAPKWMGVGLAFSKSIIASLATYKNQKVNLKSEDWNWSGKIKSLVLANGKYFGNGLCIAPDASVKSGELSCIILGDISILDYIRNVQSLKQGKKIEHKKVLYKSTTHLTIETEKECGIEADGEFIGTGSCTMSLLPKALKFLSKPFEEQG